MTPESYFTIVDTLKDWPQIAVMCSYDYLPINKNEANKYVNKDLNIVRTFWFSQ